MDHSSRQRRLQADITAGAMLVTHLPNIRYLCGFTGSSGVLLVTGRGERPVLFTDGRYSTQARAETSSTRIVIAKGPALLAAAQYARQRRLQSISVEAEHMTLATRTALRRALSGKARLRETRGTIEALRVIKDAAELALIRRAVDLGARLLDVALQSIRPGIAEADVAAELEYAARRAGAEAMSFETIVASGPRSALPHGRASSARIPSRGFVVLDFGVILAGYCSDMTRTVHVGKVSATERSLYQAVREAQEAATGAVKAGIACGQVDASARRVLRRAGLARYFTHSTGHGVGLEIHEPPRLGRGQSDPLRAGMVVTIEPGAYVAGRGGVRIEDMVLVTERGCDVLTPAPKDLIEL
ncbi:MAG: M24 family metallopeptidase [Terriglobales bacterium]